MIAGWGFVFAGVVFLLVGLLPAFRGGSVDATFFILGIVFLVLGAGVARRRRGGNPPQ